MGGGFLIVVLSPISCCSCIRNPETLYVNTVMTEGCFGQHTPDIRRLIHPSDLCQVGRQIASHISSELNLFV